ncbi:Hypothetical predicted protein [Pelobates cultripes]|uniref:Uncharacterized protein n=1 Tax=Pelobates cultripes TaxID=61616 RepID=A0AAD1S413_PELCU|nr:Hypothetical predicted protein [Pelobates cultripes]
MIQMQQPRHNEKRTHNAHTPKRYPQAPTLTTRKLPLRYFPPPDTSDTEKAQQTGIVLITLQTHINGISDDYITPLLQWTDATTPKRKYTSTQLTDSTDDTQPFSSINSTTDTAYTTQAPQPKQIRAQTRYPPLSVRTLNTTEADWYTTGIEPGVPPDRHRRHTNSLSAERITPSHYHDTHTTSILLSNIQIRNTHPHHTNQTRCLT